MGKTTVTRHLSFKEFALRPQSAATTAILSTASSDLQRTNDYLAQALAAKSAVLANPKWRGDAIHAIRMAIGHFNEALNIIGAIKDDSYIMAVPGNQFLTSSSASQRCQLFENMSSIFPYSRYGCTQLDCGNKGNRMLKCPNGILSAMVCVLLAVAPQPSLAAGAPKGECANLWKMYGLFMSASLTCNFAESNAIRKTLHRLKQVCPQSTEQQARRYVKSGFSEFDKQLKRDGRPKACGEMFTFMDAIGG